MKTTTSRRQGESLLVLGLLLGFLAWAWWTNVPEAMIKSVLDGFSPLDWVAQFSRPADYARNFPSGIDNYDKSLPMFAYPLLAQHFGIEPERLLPAFIAFELVALSLALAFLVRTLLPSAPVAVILLVVVLVIGSWTRTMDLGRFGGPYFWGLFYNLADALRLLGIAFALRQRWWLAGLMLGLACATHTTIGVIGVAFVACAVLATPGRLLTPGPWKGALVLAAIAGAWIAFSFRSAAMVVSDIPASDWLTLTRMFSYHWYPVANGLLSTQRHAVLVPLLSFLMLALFYASRAGIEPPIKRQLLAGSVAMLGLAAVGVIVSSALPVPTLIKLALQRSTDLVVLVGLPVVAWGLLREIQQGHWLRGMLAGAILLSPFIFRPGFPLLLTIPLVVPAFAALRHPPRHAEDRATAWLAVSTLVYLAVGHVLWGGLGADELFSSAALVPAVVAVTVFAVAVRWVPSSRSLVPSAFALCAVAFAAYLLHAKQPLWRAPEAVAYRQAQEWARSNTPSRALFLVDPTIFYGWRDYSHRGSFGNLREWLHTSWLYDSRSDRYLEGLRRLSEFGLEPFGFSGRQPIAVNDHLALAEALRKRFYGASDEDVIGIAACNEIDFLVARKALEAGRRSLEVAFENDQYVVYAIPGRPGVVASESAGREDPASCTRR